MKLYEQMQQSKNKEDASVFVKEIEVVVDNKFDTKKNTCNQRRYYASTFRNK